METSSKNRRRSQRKLPRSSAKVECRKGTTGLGPNLAVQLLDISETGAGVILKTPLDLDEEVEVLILDFGQAKPIKQIARVCWCLPLQDGRYCAGLRFEKYAPYKEIQLIARPAASSSAGLARKS